MKCRAMEQKMAISNHGFPNIPICRSEESSERALTALNISMVTSTESESVDALFFPLVK